MNIFIIVYDNIEDRHSSGNPLFEDHYAYKTREIAQKYWKHLGDSRFGFRIKEIELLEE